MVSVRMNVSAYHLAHGLVRQSPLHNRAKRNYANPLARPALRRANVDETTGLHVGSGVDAHAWYRREHNDFQRH